MNTLAIRARLHDTMYIIRLFNNSIIIAFFFEQPNKRSKPCLLEDSIEFKIDIFNIIIAAINIVILSIFVKVDDAVIC